MRSIWPDLRQWEPPINASFSIGQENSKAALDFATSLAACRSPTDSLNLTQDYARQQMEAVQRQTRELLEIAQKPAGSPTTWRLPPSAVAPVDEWYGLGCGGRQVRCAGVTFRADDAIEGCAVAR